MHHLNTISTCAILIPIPNLIEDDFRLQVGVQLETELVLHHLPCPIDNKRSKVFQVD